ncbi:NADH-ubiquinone oxidoreductase-F iron-sulfur binding region domain-containing protein [Streptacidiphilus rugosus]|uniref:NADH-ubiquinone oxidoreductase-F iron-sulfur binding region domain-containing protein n=1 Tax=Streptacidiphilus rugosus TaxID=405783 RepID=UPI00068D07C0|nr:NADH-ubiquinone oxidoreductase-F iron-sulfur binding region domain-containing protein [Streptacidiphilus rugosus]
MQPLTATPAVEAQVREASAVGTPALLLGTAPQRREDAAAYRAVGGYRPTGPAEQLERRLAAADLRGRGGAGFPAAVKIAGVNAQPPGPRTVIANGTEGEPASVKDRFLTRMRPHLVLDGVAHAAAAVGAQQAFVVVSDAPAANSLRRALRENPPEWPLRIEVRLVPEAYVAGEESALVRHLDGGPALPTAKPPRVFEAGVGGEPTLVLNVETLAHLALLASGASGRADTFLATVSGLGHRPALYELPYGTVLGELLAHHAGEAPGTTAATATDVLLGGFFGGVLAADPGLVLAPASLRTLGAQLGCGAVVALGPQDCPVHAAADILGYLAAESAKQCGACLRGTAAMAQALAALCRGEAAAEQVEQLRRWSTTLPGRGACGLLDAAAGNVAALLRTRPDAVAEHVAAACPRCAAHGGFPRRTRFALDLALLPEPA